MVECRTPTDARAPLVLRFQQTLTSVKAIQRGLRAVVWRARSQAFPTRAPVTPKVVHVSSDQISKYMWMVEEPSSHTILPERRPSVDPPKIIRSMHTSAKKTKCAHRASADPPTATCAVHQSSWAIASARFCASACRRVSRTASTITLATSALVQ